MSEENLFENGVEKATWTQDAVYIKFSEDLLMQDWDVGATLIFTVTESVGSDYLDIS